MISSVNEYLQSMHGDFAFSKHLLLFHNFKLVVEISFLPFLWSVPPYRQMSVHIVKLKQYFTLSLGLFAVNEPKDTISVVHVNKMPATVS